MAQANLSNIPYEIPAEIEMNRFTLEEIEFLELKKEQEEQQ